MERWYEIMKHYLSLTIAMIIALPSICILLIWVLIQKPIPIKKEHLPKD